MDGQQPQADPAQQLLNLIIQINQRLQVLENRPEQPAAAPQGLQQQQPPPGPANVLRAAATDFGYSPEQVASSYRELSDRVRAIPIPTSASVNTTKPRGASTGTRAELDSIAKIAPIAKLLIQLYSLSQQEDNHLTLDQLAQANLILGLHLTGILQARQGDLFVEATFPDAYDTFRALRAGPGGSLAGEELSRLTTAIQLSGQQQQQQQQQQQHRSSHRGNYNTQRGGYSNRGSFHNNINNFGGRGGHQGSNYNSYNGHNQRGGFQQE
jgi:hypothetical protein